MDNTSDKHEASKELVRIADQMERCDPGSPEYKELNREYKRCALILQEGNDPNEFALPADKITASKQACYQKILEVLKDIPAWQARMEVINTDHIEFAYWDNWKGIGVEIQFKICDQLQKAISGCKALRCRANLVMCHELDTYPSYEYGLLHFTMRFLSGQEREDFVKAYVMLYNEKINNLKQQMHSKKIK